MSDNQEDYRLTARQKMRLYLITLFVAAFLYVVPQIPREVWQFALWIPLVMIGGGLLVGALAIVLGLRFAQKAVNAKISMSGFGGGKKEKGRVVVGRWSDEEEEEAGAHS